MSAEFSEKTQPSAPTEAPAKAEGRETPPLAKGDWTPTSELQAPTAPEDMESQDTGAPREEALPKESVAAKEAVAPQEGATPKEGAPKDWSKLNRDELNAAHGDWSTQEKGKVGERAMCNDIERQGMVMIASHPDNPNQRGFDGVYWDPQEKRLHLAEAKFYPSGKGVSEKDLSAMSTEHWRNNLNETRRAIKDSSLSAEDQKACLDQLYKRQAAIDIYVAGEAGIDPSAARWLDHRSTEVTVHNYDGRDIWAQQRRVAREKAG